MQTAKHTEWKKNRKFGDVFGGRMRVKLADRVFNRQHSLAPPVDGQDTPIFLIDNPSKDFFFPVSPDDIKEVLAQLPTEHVGHLTHVWLHKVKKEDYLYNQTLQGAFICGSGVNLIILYAFPIDLKMRLGVQKPTRKTLGFYKEFSPHLEEDSFGWYLQWQSESIRRYYLQSLLLHEIGHAVDSFHLRFWSKAAKKQTEDFANDYAVCWSNTVREAIL